MTDHDSCLLAIVTLQHRLGEAPGTVWTPDRLLGVVGLGLGLPLHLERHHEVGAGVRVLPPSGPELDMTRHLESAHSMSGTLCEEIMKAHSIYMDSGRCLSLIVTQNLEC